MSWSGSAWGPLEERHAGIVVGVECMRGEVGGDEVSKR